MSLEKKFIKKGLKKVKLEEFFNGEYERAGYAGCDIRRTPMGVKITLYADKPGLIIGRGGGRINEVREKLSKEFGFEDPQLDVQEIEKPELNADIVAKEIKNAIEGGTQHRRVANGILRSIMERGATGAEIRISGKLSGARGRTEKFTDGYLKSCGEPAKLLVDEAVAHAKTKPGTIGVKVKIMEGEPAKPSDEGEDEQKIKLKEGMIEKITDQPISDGKEMLEKSGNLKKKDYEKVLKYEKDGKDRKGMKKFLNKKIKECESEENGNSEE